MAQTGRPARVLRVGSVMGVPVELTPSWFLLAALVTVAYGPALSGGDPVRGHAAAACFAVLLLASVLLHEVGHCLAARLLGLRVRRIGVSFLAGVTEVTDPPPTPGRAADPHTRRRRSSKNRCITRRHSASSTPPATATRWLSDGCS